ncbi:hypothetical protein CsSME_00022980 [Camellia sinensis var. sinensis]
MEDPFCAFQLAQLATTHRDKTEGGRPTNSGGQPTTSPGRPTSSKGSGGRGWPANSKGSGGRPAHLVVSQLNWSLRRKGGLLPLYHLPNNENRLHAKNEPRRIQNEGGPPGHSVPLERGNKVCAKSRSKQRKLSSPEPRRTADDSENQKLVSKREQWSTTAKSSLRPLRDGLRDLSLPSGRENRTWFANRGKAQNSPEVWRQGSQSKLQNLRTSTTCTITERSIGDVRVLRSVKNGVSTV